MNGYSSCILLPAQCWDWNPALILQQYSLLTVQRRTSGEKRRNTYQVEWQKGITACVRWIQMMLEVEAWTCRKVLSSSWVHYSCSLRMHDFSEWLVCDILWQLFLRKVPLNPQEDMNRSSILQLLKNLWPFGLHWEGYFVSKAALFYSTKYSEVIVSR